MRRETTPPYSHTGDERKLVMFFYTLLREVADDGDDGCWRSDFCGSTKCSAQ